MRPQGGGWLFLSGLGHPDGLIVGGWQVGGVRAVGRRGQEVEVRLPKGQGQPCAQRVLHGAVGSHSAVHRAVTVQADGRQVARLRGWWQVWLGVRPLPETAEPDAAGRDPAQQQQKDSEQDEPHVPQAAPAGLGRAPAGQQHLEQAGRGPADRPARTSPPPPGEGPERCSLLPPQSPNLLVRGVAAAFREAQRHLWGQGCVRAGARQAQTRPMVP
uniref:Transmembrane protein 52 isoform X1 n=1 Tax=Sus scrofa TaxID=9823 RepID=A0A480FES0_PIG